MHEDKIILDACCGSRMFWFDRHERHTVYMDCRRLETTLCDGRSLVVDPDVLGDFRNIPFPDGRFRPVVFDPPNLVNVGDKSWMAQKYGRLAPETWRDDLRCGFSECFRVLEPHGILVFKWNEQQIGIGEVVRLAPASPLFGQRSGKTHWLVFLKEARG